MIESIFKRQFTRNIHKSAPFLQERESYLQYLFSRGKNKDQLKREASVLLHIIRLLRLDTLRPVDRPEIRVAAEQWAAETNWQRNLRGRKSAADRFMYSAQRWFRFQNVLVMPSKQHSWFDDYLDQFEQGLHASGLRTATRFNYLRRARAFFAATTMKQSSISEITLSDVDEYIAERLRVGCSHKTIESEYQGLRCFFRYAESRGWCMRGFADVLRTPFRRQRSTSNRGQTWKDVRRLIDSCNRDNHADLRAKAILLLCSVYGFRGGEVIRLRLNDLDWHKEVITIRRSKSGRIQQFPIQYEVGEAIIRYLKLARPNHASCRNLFMTQYAPYRPLEALWPIISRRMKKVGIASPNVGPHALRHACATELLRRGASLREIADFLGHKSLSSVSIYAKHDWRSLRAVAKASLAGVL